MRFVAFATFAVVYAILSRSVVAQQNRS